MTPKRTVSTKLPFSTLIALIVGSMIGGGIFNLPQNMAVGAGAGAILVGWLITSIGMFALCWVYQILALRKPKLNNGVYAYARASAGEFIGFNSAWGYWISAWLGNVSYLIASCGALQYFFPAFGEGNTPIAILVASVVLWLIHFFILQGIKSAMVLNTIITGAKILPLVLFIVVTSLFFQADIFRSNFWGYNTPHSFLTQVKSTMLVTVWLFVGIESISVYSARARNRADIGKATFIGFVVTLLLLMCVSLLSLGILPQAELINLKTLSMAGVLEKTMGYWGALIIVFGLILSTGGAFLAWTLLAAEALFTPAKDQLMPRWLAKENDKGVPSNALWLTNGLVQLFLIITLFSKMTYLALILLATTMILVPYLFSAIYAVKITFFDKSCVHQHPLQPKEYVISSIATVYCCWLFYAAGLKYLLLSTLLYLPSSVFYILAKRQQGKIALQLFERVILSILFLLGIIAIYLLKTGELTF